jgi:uncharacterized membrane protein YgcG
MISVPLYAEVSPQVQIPSLAPVVDLANVLTAAEHQELDQKIRAIRSSGLMHSAVLIIPSLNNEAIESFSHRVFDQWRLGTKEDDNGLIIIFSINDHKMRIEVGQGLEGAITDLESSRVLRSLKEELRAKQYKSAIYSALVQLEALAKKDLKADYASSAKALEKTKADTKEGIKVFGNICLVIFSFLLFAAIILELKKSSTCKNSIRHFSKLLKEEKEQINELEKEYETSLAEELRLKALLTPDHWKAKENDQRITILLKEIALVKSKLYTQPEKYVAKRIGSQK